MEIPPLYQDALHQIVLYTAQRQPLLEKEIKGIAQTALKNLPSRYPGLRILKFEIHPDRVEMTLDFQRLDEDLRRVLQSFKAEVKNLAQKRKQNSDDFWQWTFEEK